MNEGGVRRRVFWENFGAAEGGATSGEWGNTRMSRRMDATPLESENPSETTSRSGNR